MKNFFSIGLFFINNFANAEYRAYQYLVTHRTPKIQDNNPYMVMTTLNPVAYVQYHGGPESVKIDLLRTWVCPGHTGRKEICPSPYTMSIPNTGTTP